MTIYPKLFDPERYPRLRRVAESDRYGRMVLHSVSETSDGFLIGRATVHEGEEHEHQHSVFLGTVRDFK